MSYRCLEKGRLLLCSPSTTQKPLNHRDPGLIYSVCFAEEIVLPWAGSSEDQKLNGEGESGLDEWADQL